MGNRAKRFCSHGVGVKNGAFPQGFDLNDIVFVLALASHRTMSAAARHLGLDVSTVSRRIASAEGALGLRLFIRSGATYELTEAGATFVGQAEGIYDRINTMLLTSSQDAEGMTGVVRITSIDVLLDYWIVDSLPALRQAHPGIEVHLDASDRNLSFTKREADLALRLSRPTEDAALVMRKYGDLGFSVYAPRQFADAPRSEWPELPWISYHDSLFHTPEMQWLDTLGVRARSRLRVSSIGTMIRACVAGNGMALLPTLLGEVPGLVNLSDTAETSREVWLLSHRDARSIARFKVVSDWLTLIHDESMGRFSGASSR